MSTGLERASVVPATPIGDVERSVVRLDSWLDTMRGPEGYGGPVSHWWQQCFTYTGAGLDWRYEGIILGYLNLWKRTEDPVWLAKAQRAGNDLLQGQAANVHFLASAFELNPASGGTPHEAACDLALLELASALHTIDDPNWATYLDAAQRNLESFYIGLLWSEESKSIHDGPGEDSFVPNKAATACAALMKLAEVTGDGCIIDRYVVPTLDRVLEHQVSGTVLDGAIAQNSYRGTRVESYFPIYISRCVPPLVHATVITGDERYLDAAVRAMRFVERHVNDYGRLPSVIYGRGRSTKEYFWIAALGDVLTARDIVAANGVHIDIGIVLDVLLSGQDETGGFQTARGLGTLTGHKATPPDVRDLLHVAGWCDKAFHYLTSHITAMPGDVADTEFVYEADCQLYGKAMRFVETHDRLEIMANGRVRYRWQKGQSWPDVSAPEFWLR